MYSVHTDTMYDCRLIMKRRERHEGIEKCSCTLLCIKFRNINIFWGNSQKHTHTHVWFRGGWYLLDRWTDRLKLIVLHSLCWNALKWERWRNSQVSRLISYDISCWQYIRIQLRPWWLSTVLINWDKIWAGTLLTHTSARPMAPAEVCKDVPHTLESQLDTLDTFWPYRQLTQRAWSTMSEIPVWFSFLRTAGGGSRRRLLVLICQNVSLLDWRSRSFPEGECPGDWRACIAQDGGWPTCMAEWGGEMN